MQGIEFEEDRNFSGLSTQAQQRPAPKQSLIMGLVAKMGITDTATANYILLGVAMLFFGIAIFLYAGVLGENIPSKQSADQIAAQLRVLREMQNLK